MTADPLNLAALREVAEEGARGWIPSGSTFRTTFDPPTVLALLDLAERATADAAAIKAEGLREAADELAFGHQADKPRDPRFGVADWLRARAAALDPAPASEVRDDEPLVPDDFDPFNGGVS